MPNIKQEFVASSALTITLASLASDTALLAGWESAEYDNSASKYLDVHLAGKITTGTTPTTARQIEVHVVAQAEDSTYPDVFDGTDSAESITSAEIKPSVCKVACIMPTSSASDRTYWFSGISVAELFGGRLPRKFSVFVVHNTGVNLHATGGNHAIWVTPIYYTAA